MKLMPLIIFGVLLNALAQLFLKAGMNKIGHFDFTFANIFPIGMQVATNLYIMAGLTCYVLSVVVWLLVLSRVDVSFAYPMVSIGYIINGVAAWALLGEDLSLTRIAGILVIVTGVFLVSQST